MQVKVMNEAGFQILTSAMSIGPSQTGYVLEVSADGKNFSPLFSVAANTTKMATGLAPNAYYRLKGNVGEVIVNWSRSCVIDGEGGSGTTYTAGNYIDLTGDVISVTGITPDLYATSADVETMINTKAADYTPTSGFSTINGSAITNGSAIVIEAGGDIAPLSAAVETLSAATVGKADAATSITTYSYITGRLVKHNSQGIITGSSKELVGIGITINDKSATTVSNTSFPGGIFANIYAPTAAGTAGNILVSTGNGAPVWSAATFAQESDLNTLSAATVSAIATIPENPVQSLSIDTIWKGDIDAYNALTNSGQTADASTLYIITGSTS